MPDNNSDKTVWIKPTVSDLSSNTSPISYATLPLSSNITDQNQIIVLRKFDLTSISGIDSSTVPVTADEAYGVWALPNFDLAGSPMYTVNEADQTISFSDTAADYTWYTGTSKHHERGSDIVLPAFDKSTDTVYIVRKTYALDRMIKWTPGSKLTDDSLNLQNEQFMQLIQEAVGLNNDSYEISPTYDMPNGVCGLDSTGKIAAAKMGNVGTDDGVTGTGISTDKIRLALYNASLAITSDQVHVNTVDNLTSTSTIQPLSANQGKELRELIDAIGTGISYKGTTDMTSSAADLTGVQDGWTFDNTGAGGADSQWEGGGAITVSAGQTYRYYNGTWNLLVTTSAVNVNGTSTLTGHWDIVGDTYHPKFTTQATNNNTTFPATTAYVKQEIEAAILPELADVTAYSSIADGDVLKRVSGGWLNVTPDDGTNGISIGDLKDVNTTGAANTKILKHNGSAWVVASETTTEAIKTSTGGDASADDSAAVKTAIDAAGEGGSYSASQIKILDFRGRTHVITDNTTGTGTDTEIVTDNFIWRNGTFNYSNTCSNGRTIFGTGALTAIEQNLAIASNYDRIGNDYVVYEGADSYNVGDLVKLESDEYVRGSSTKYFQLMVVRKKDTTNNKLWFTEDIKIPFAGATTKGTIATQRQGTKVMENMVFENLVIDCIKNKVEPIATDTISTSTSTNTKAILAYASHGYTTGIRMDMEGVDLTASVTTTTDSDDGSHTWKYKAINRSTTPTISDTDALDIVYSTDLNGTMLNTATTANTGGARGMVSFGQCTAIALQGCRNVVFKNCTFKNMGAGGVGIYLTSCKDVLIEGCTFEGAKGFNALGNAIKLRNCQDVKISNNTIRKCNIGMYIDYACSGLIVSNNNIECDYAGFFVNGTGLWDSIIDSNHITMTPSNNQMFLPSGSNMGAPTTSAIRVWGYNTDITNNTIGGTRDLRGAPAWSASAFYAIGHGIDFYASTRTSNKHASCPITKYGILAYPTRGTTLSADTKIGEGIRIKGNKIHSRHYGVYIAPYGSNGSTLAPVSGLVISGNEIISTHYGIRIALSLNNTEKLWHTDISNNNITLARALVENWSNGTGAYGTTDGIAHETNQNAIYLYVSAATSNEDTAMYGVTIHGNKFVCVKRHDSGYSSEGGGSASTTASIRIADNYAPVFTEPSNATIQHLHIQQNFSKNFRNGLYENAGGVVANSSWVSNMGTNLTNTFVGPISPNTWSGTNNTQKFSRYYSYQSLNE